MSEPSSGAPRGTYAWIRQNVLGLVAIFIALSGTAVATQVASDAVKVAKFKRGPRGPAGPAGPQGSQGLQGAQGPVGPLTGAAGGDLTGNYPNPEIGPGKVGAPELAEFSVGANNFAFDIPWARATRTANQTIPDSTDTALAFDSERFDSGTLHDNATDNSRLTATGTYPHLYLITASVQFAPGAGQLSLYLRRNGATAIANETRTGAGDPTSITISTITFLSPGAYVEAVVRQGTGAPLDVVKNPEFSPEFAMALLPSND